MTNGLVRRVMSAIRWARAQPDAREVMAGVLALDAQTYIQIRTYLMWEYRTR